jgi:transcriptional regulator with XRE-family HTH domain
MKMNKALRAMLETAQQSDSYWVEQAKLDFALALEQRRRAANMTGADIAEKIGTSAAYISKVFRGDSNYTIETMVKLARATGGQLDIRLLDEHAAPILWNNKASATKPKLTLVTGGITTQVNPVPGGRANWLKVAA